MYKSSIIDIKALFNMTGPFNPPLTLTNLPSDNHKQIPT